MRKRISVPLTTAGVLAGSLFVVQSPAQAHGYVSTPPSRQAQCAKGAITGCGDVVFEPQSVEAPKGSTQCNGGGSRFAVLNDNSKPWPTSQVGSTVTFNWVLTARHSTSTWEYFIGGTKLAEFNDGGKQPNATVTHSVSMKGFTGRQTIFARWNIADTPMAFYNCIDVQIGGGGGNNNPPPTNQPPTNPPPSTQPPTNPPPGNPPPQNPPPQNPPPVTSGGTWKPGTAYATGSTVTYNGRTYRCRQGHTTLPGWEPPHVLALWLPI